MLRCRRRTQVTKTRANRIPNKWGETTDADGHW